MKINIDYKSNLPMQKQIFEKIRAMILSGLFTMDAELPSIRAFARNNQVSVITVQNAYQMLEAEGLIYSRRGKGFFVAELASKKREQLAAESFIATFEPLFNKALQEGLSIEQLKNIIEKSISKR